MTIAKRELIDRFFRGEYRGKASREIIKTINDVPIILGYRWAVYLAELPDGRYALFGDGYASDGDDVGWAGYSGQTTQHLQELKGSLEERGHPYVVVDAQLRAKPGWSARGGAGDRPALSDMTEDELLAFVEENSVEPAEGTGYTMTLNRGRR